MSVHLWQSVGPKVSNSRPSANENGAAIISASAWQNSPKTRRPTSMRIRRFVLVLAWVLVLFAGPGGGQASTQPADVPMFRGNPAHTGEMPGPGPQGNPSARWRFDTGDGVYSSPAVVGGVVYVGSDDRNVYALDAATGQERWRFVTE